MIKLLVKSSLKATSVLTCPPNISKMHFIRSRNFNIKGLKTSGKSA